MKDVVKLVYPNTNKETELFYSPNADPRVVAKIEQNIHSGKRFRVFYGDTERSDFEAVHGGQPDPGLDWGEEYDVTGTIGRSTGWKPIPLLINNSRSMGGGAIMTDCIVRIIIDGQEVYRHENYHNKYDNALILKSDLPEYSHMVVSQDNGELDIQARFRTEKSARNWLAFMRGERMSK